MSRIDASRTDSVSVPGAQASSAVDRVVEAYLAHRLGSRASSHHFDTMCPYLQRLFPGTPFLEGDSLGDSIYSAEITDHHPWSAATSIA